MSHAIIYHKQIQGELLVVFQNTMCIFNASLHCEWMNGIGNNMMVQYDMSQ